jgi:hypothetical protein
MAQANLHIYSICQYCYYLYLPFPFYTLQFPFIYSLFLFKFDSFVNFMLLSQESPYSYFDSIYGIVYSSLFLIIIFLFLLFFPTWFKPIVLYLLKFLKLNTMLISIYFFCYNASKYLNFCVFI